MALEKVNVVDDIEGCEGGGHIMTDGCGYIWSSLVQHIPVGISSGKPREERREGVKTLKISRIHK